MTMRRRVSDDGKQKQNQSIYIRLLAIGQFGICLNEEGCIEVRGEHTFNGVARGEGKRGDPNRS